MGRDPDWLLASVRSSVWRRQPVDGREARSRHRTLVALARLARPFDPDTDRTHVTGSALITGPKGVLLHRHKRLGLWLQPGGHLQAAETPWDAARREAAEETGLAFDWVVTGRDGVPPLAHMDVHPGPLGHVHLDLRYRLTLAGRDEPAPPPGESQEVRWFPWPEALARADPGLAGWVRSEMDSLPAGRPTT